MLVVLDRCSLHHRYNTIRLIDLSRNNILNACDAVVQWTLNFRYLFSCALHDFYGNGIDFVMHLHCPPFPTANLYQKHSEVCSTEVQSEKISIFCITNQNSFSHHLKQMQTEKVEYFPKTLRNIDLPKNL